MLTGLSPSTTYYVRVRAQNGRERDATRAVERLSASCEWLAASELPDAQALSSWLKSLYRSSCW